MIIKILKKKIQLKLSCNKIKIYNESHKHNSNPSLKNSHYKILIISNDFSNINLIDRHRKIYFLLTECINKYKIKSLSIYTYTILEWTNIKKTNILNSPACKNVFNY